ncbi:MAG: DJ-1/PfpI family protein [Mycoplasmataceae bacterium]|nr:DJ-1/PfpI family protein [Mycoplasmataceae bacterium]
MNKIAVISFDGVEDTELFTAIDIFFRAGIIVDIYNVSDSNHTVTRSKLKFLSDKNISNLNSNEYDLLYLPGGPGVNEIMNNKLLDEKVNDFFRNNKLIAAICAAPMILAKNGILKDTSFISHPSVIEYCESKGGRYFGDSKDIAFQSNIITSRNFTTTYKFSMFIVEKLLGSDFKTKLEEGF